MADNIKENEIPVKELQYALGFDSEGKWAKNPPETGIDGVTYTPSVSPDGTLSWTNDGGEPNPDPVNIKGPRGATGDPGPKGDPGDAGTLAKTTDARVTPGIIKPSEYRNSRQDKPNSLLVYNSEGRACTVDVVINDATVYEMGELIQGLWENGDVSCYLLGQCTNGWKGPDKDDYEGFLKISADGRRDIFVLVTEVSGAKFIGYKEAYRSEITWMMMNPCSPTQTGFYSAFISWIGFGSVQPDPNHKGLDIGEVLYYDNQDDLNLPIGNLVKGAESVVYLMPTDVDYVYPLFLPDLYELYGDAYYLLRDPALQKNTNGCVRKVRIYCDFSFLDDNFKMAFVVKQYNSVNYNLTYNDDKEFFRGETPFNETRYYQRVSEQYPDINPKRFILDIRFASMVDMNFRNSKGNTFGMFVSITPILSDANGSGFINYAKWQSLLPTEATEAAASTFAARAAKASPTDTETDEMPEWVKARIEALYGGTDIDVTPPQPRPNWRERIKAMHAARAAERAASTGAEAEGAGKEVADAE